MGDVEGLVEFEKADFLGYTVDELVCTNCIEGFCPARTPSVFEQTEFTFCGAKKIADGVVAAYTQRMGIELNIQKPC